MIESRSKMQKRPASSLIAAQSEHIRTNGEARHIVVWRNGGRMKEIGGGQQVCYRPRTGVRSDDDRRRFVRRGEGRGGLGRGGGRQPAVALGEPAEEAHGALDVDVAVLLSLEGRALLQDHHQRPRRLVVERLVVVAAAATAAAPFSSSCLVPSTQKGSRRTQHKTLLSMRCCSPKA